MFLAIINDTYSEVKADYSIGRRPDFQLGKMIKKVCISNSPHQNSEANLVWLIPQVVVQGGVLGFCFGRQWHPTPVLLPRKSHGRRSLVGCSPWRRWSWTRLSNFTFTFHFHALEKAMATHSSVLAWRIPGTGSLVGCRLWGRTESDTTKATQQQQCYSYLYCFTTRRNVLWL